MDDEHHVETGSAASIWLIVKRGLTGGIIVVIVVHFMVLDLLLEDPHARVPSNLREWVLLLAIAFVVGFVPACSWAIWKTHFPRSEQELDEAGEKKV